MKPFKFFAIVLLCLSSICGFSQTEIYISPSGSDSAYGSETSPFATLARAQAKARELGEQVGGITVFLRGGTYPVTSTLSLTAKDSGGPGRPLTFKAYPEEEVILDGGEEINTEGFIIATNTSELHADAANIVHVKTITNAAEIKLLKDKSTMLTLDGKMLGVARFPNIGFGQVNSSTVASEGADDSKGTMDSPVGPKFQLKETSPVFSNWSAEYSRLQKAIFKGYLSSDWLSEEIEIASISSSGEIRLKDATKYGMSNTITRGFVSGLLCELDQAGEWFYDDVENKLYIFPYDISITPTMRLTCWGGDEVFNLTNVEYVNIQNMTIQNLGGQNNGEGAITMTGYSRHCQIAGMTFRYIASPMSAVNITGGAKDCGMLSCDVYDVSNATRLYGGSVTAEEIVPAYNYIENCHFTQMYSKDFYGKSCGVSGAGNIFRNNLIHNENGQTVTFAGCEHLLELNEVFNAGIEEGDGGCFYTGADVASFGNVIQHNFMHHIMSVPQLLNRSAFFSDDYDAGDTYRENVLYKGGGEGIKMNSGGGHRVEGNLIMEGHKGITHLYDWRGTFYNTQKGFLNGTATSTSKNNQIGRMLQKYGEVGWEDGLTADNWLSRIHPAWMERYPVFKELMEGYFNNKTMLPYATEYIDNHFYSNNTDVSAPEIISISGSQQITSTSIFTNVDAMDFSYSAETTSMPDIPFVNIGLYVDQFRRQMPDKDTYRAAVKTRFDNQTVEASGSYNYQTINQLLYYHTGEVVMNTIPASGATAPIVKFLLPTNGSELVPGQDIDVSIDATDEGSVASVSLYLNDTLVSTKTAAPYEWKGSDGLAPLDSMDAGVYLIRAIATDNEGNTSTVWNRMMVIEPEVVVEVVNVALNKPAQQSSTRPGNEIREQAAHVCDGYYSNMEGNADSAYQSTQFETNPWVEINLEANYNIYSVDVWNRIGVADRMTGFYVLVSDYPFVSGDLSVLLEDPQVIAKYFAGTCARPTKMEIGSTGRYVRLQLNGRNYLHAAEVEVNVLPLDIVPATNVKPIANIANNKYLFELDTIILDGSQSSDYEDDTLTYMWTVPEGIILHDGETSQPWFIAPDVAAETEYDISLIVNDGTVNSIPYAVTFKVLPNAAPIIRMGNDLKVLENQVVTVDASGTTDREGKELNYMWSLPAGFVSEDTTSNVLVFTAPIVESIGSYYCVLTVSDGYLMVTDSIMIEVEYNHAPVAELLIDVNGGIKSMSVSMGYKMFFNASKSSDYETKKNKLLFSFTCSNPDVEFFDTDTEFPFIVVPSTPDTTNVYYVYLVVSDGMKSSIVDTVMYTVSDLKVIAGVKPIVSIDVNIYPNPVRVFEELVIEVQENVNATVFDTFGRQLISEISREGSTLNLFIPEAGLYFIQLTSDEGDVISINKVVVVD